MTDIAEIHSTPEADSWLELEQRFARASDSALALFDLLSAAGGSPELLATDTVGKAGTSGYRAVQDACQAFEELLKLHLHGRKQVDCPHGTHHHL